MSHASHRAHGIVFVLLAVTLSAQKTTAQNQPPVWSAKPDIPSFERMENDRLAAAQRAVEQMVAAKGPRTVENTLAPYDEAVRQLNAAIYFSQLIQQVHPDATFRDRATLMTTKVSGAQTALSLNRNVYQALAALDVSQADAPTRYYVQRQLLEFHLAGVDKDDATRGNLKKLNDRLTEDQSMFDRNISDGVKTIEVSNASELDGLPLDYIKNHKPDAAGKIHLTTNYPDLFPVLTFAKSDELRQRLWIAWNTRAYPKNVEVLRDMMQVRYEIATLVGYSSWADYSAADKMMVTGNNVARFIADLDAAARPLAKREFGLLMAEKLKTNPAATGMYGYESFYFAELVRRTQYDFDSQSVRPYFPYKHVKQGVLDTAAKLFHVSFRQETDAPAWNPAVETWDLIEDGKITGRFYLDMHPRPGKYSHGQMAPILDGVRGKQLPEAILECNFPQPTADNPGLMEYTQVVTFFHEFGHLMHHLLGGQQRWAGISGIAMEADFTEAPSQMLEEWMRSPQVLASFARHYKTGEPIPADLVARMNQASAFGRGGDVTLQNALSAISFDVYKNPPKETDLDAICAHDLASYTWLTPLDTDERMYASFNHLANYSSTYYTYMFDKVIAEDFFQQFDHQNLLAGEAPLKYRRMVLEPGGSLSANTMVKNFLGRPQTMAAFQRWMGAEFAGGDQEKKGTE